MLWHAMRYMYNVWRVSRPHLVHMDHKPPGYMIDTLTTSPTLTKSLHKLATVHNIDMSSHVDMLTGDAFTTLASFQARGAALRGARKALKDNDSATADDCTIAADALKADNRNDVRAMLKGAATMSRRDRALLTVLAVKGV